MWTNVFRIGDLNIVSWFQFLPCESDTNTLSEDSAKTDERGACTLSVLTAHLKLQSEGFLSTWTNSFVGPWDPSQGVHNPDEKIKLWLFLPGRHTSVADAAKTSVAKLKVVGSGIWLAPGDSEEVAFALSQSLRYRIERSLKTLSYERFGDVFTRCQSFSSIEKNYRTMQPTVEFIFSATEEAVYVMALISAKNIRGLSSNDAEKASRPYFSHTSREGMPVIVAPNGMKGRFNGCSPSDLVKQAYSSTISNGISAHGMSPGVSQLKGQSCYVEVTLGCSSSVAADISEHKNTMSDQLPVPEKTFIFPAEKVLVPFLHGAFVHFSFRRLWLQNWFEICASDMQQGWPFSGGSFVKNCLGVGSADDIRFSDNLFFESTYMHPNNGRSQSASSSISSTSSTSSESDDTMASGAYELEADSDSLTCRQSGVSSSDQFGSVGSRMVSKRTRSSVTESHGQVGTPASGVSQEQYKPDGHMDEAGIPVAVRADNQAEYWDWGDEDKEVDVDIHSLIADYGDFGDFFKDDLLAFGEPPGTELQAVIYSAAEYSDIMCGMYTGRVDPPDQDLLPALSFPPLEDFNLLPPHTNMESFDRPLEIARNAHRPSSTGHVTAPSSGMYDHLTKAEAMMTFASEYSAVEAPKSELSSSIFKNPYLPKSKNAEIPPSRSSGYVYSATPPSSPHLPRLEDPGEILDATKTVNEVQETGSCNLPLKFYSFVEGQKVQGERKPFSLEELASAKEDAISSVSIHLHSPIISQRKNTENIHETGISLLSPKILLATEVECGMLQASMCRIRHTLLSCSSQVFPFNRLSTAGIAEHQVLGDPGVTSTMPSNSYDVKKDMIPVRIAGDADGILERAFSAPVGVWRTVGAAKSVKSSDMLTIDSSSTFPNNMLTTEGFPLNGRRLGLQDFLDSLPFLVQQATSFVDISLDALDGEGPYAWLALHEQVRRGFCCGPTMVHAGCGGLLASCHSFDIAGVDLINPLSADVHPSTVISLLQSDIRLALRSSFGNLDGPLSMTDWCKCHNQSGDIDMHFVECNANESRDPSSTITFGGEPISPSTALTGVASSMKDGTRLEESSQRRMNQEADQAIANPRSKTSISVISQPALFVGYQDDWLKTSVSSLKLWEKAPFEPYALPKSITYCAVCPDIDFLTSAATDFFTQLGTVYEACKLGSHLPYLGGTQMELASRKLSSSGLILIDCPQTVKIGADNVSQISAMNDYLVALSKGWDLASYLRSLAKVLKSLKVCSSTGNQKEGSSSPCMVIYVICPFPEPNAILQTVIESSAAIGSYLFASDKEGQTSLHSQVAKALNCPVTGDEAAVPNVVMLSGFNIRKVVLQIVSIDLLLRVSKPVDDLAMFKEISFTVYNKARRIPCPFYNTEMSPSSTYVSRSHSTLMNVSSPTPGLWKDCLTPRISGVQIARENELDSAMRHGSWDNSWQTMRTSVLNSDSNKLPDYVPHDDMRYLFEPLFILAEPGSTEAGASASNFGNSTVESSISRSMMDDSSNSYLQNTISGGSAEASINSINEGSELDQKAPSLHCCYGWTEDWRWLISIWTDARGELLDNQVFPFGGISSRQDTKVLQSLFVQVLNQGCLVLSSLSYDSASSRTRDIVITRIGCFFELECQEWQKAIYSLSGNDIRKWPIHLRRSVSCISAGNSGSLQQSDMSLLQDRSIPSSPNPLYSPHSKSTSYMKGGGLGQGNPKKPLSAGQAVDSSRGLFQPVQSISLVGVSLDHSLQFVFPADGSFSGGGSQPANSSTLSGYLDGFTPTRSLGSSSHSYIFIPSSRMCHLPSNPLQLPACLTSESPPLAHLLHSKGSAIPLSTAYVASKAAPTAKRGLTGNSSDEWPSILSVSLVDHYGSSTSSFQDKVVRSCSSSGVNGRQGRNSSSDNGREHAFETQLVLENVAAELHYLSWLTVSPAYPERRTALPFHCDSLLRVRRLLHYADKQLCQTSEK